MGIDFNGVDNGIWLPTSKFGEATVHLGANSMEYKTYVYRLLWMAKNKDEALAILDAIKRQLQTGKLRINSLP